MNTRTFTTLSGTALTALFLGAASAQARSAFSLSVDLGNIAWGIASCRGGTFVSARVAAPVYAPVYAPAPVVYAPAPVVYTPPAVVYQPPVYTPPPVVYQPAPVVYQPAPVVYQPAPVVYRQPVRYCPPPQPVVYCPPRPVHCAPAYAPYDGYGPHRGHGSRRW